jgi:glycosyltransferase involved in cell wall biosynthesis
VGKGVVIVLAQFIRFCLNDLMKKTVSIINRMELSVGGSENRSLQIRQILSDVVNAEVWTEYPLDNDFHKKNNVKAIRSRWLRFPRGGVFVFVGTYFWVGTWLRFANPEKIVVIHNISDNEMLRAFLKRLAEIGVHCPVFLVYASEALKNEVNLPGRVFASPIDLDRFKPHSGERADISRPFTVGRMSRNAENKHHPDDIDIYKNLASKGIRIRLMGGDVISHLLRDVSGVEIIPAGSESPEDFLKTLDVFIYRTAPDWFEAWGRVVIEAMAQGIPVVCGNRGGYTEFVKHEVSGFVFNDNAEAIEYIDRLFDSGELRESIGKSARCAVEELFSKRSILDFSDFILSDSTDGDISPLLKSLELVSQIRFGK